MKESFHQISADVVSFNDTIKPLRLYVSLGFYVMDQHKVSQFYVFIVFLTF